jgi:hypothetical protein
MSNMTLGVHGFDSKGSIDTNQVEICKSWIKQWITKRKTINNKKWSYSLKGFVEKSSSEYISNGAFIRAAIDLGYTYRVSSPNAYFNMSFVKAKRNSKESHYLG